MTNEGGNLSDFFTWRMRGGTLSDFFYVDRCLVSIVIIPPLDERNHF